MNGKRGLVGESEKMLIFFSAIAGERNILSKETQISEKIYNFARHGGMAERSNAAVLKTVVLLTRNRGFESLFLRQVPMQQDELPRKMLILWGFLFLSQAMKSSKKHHFCGLNGGLF